MNLSIKNTDGYNEQNMVNLDELQSYELQNDELQNDELQNDELQNDELQNDEFIGTDLKKIIESEINLEM